MKMPGKIDDNMLAPCGMNCAVCYKHVGIGKHAKICAGCLNDGADNPEHCGKCKIKLCARKKQITRCLECGEFPCHLIKNLERSYTRRYNVSLIQNSVAAGKKGVSAFLKRDCKSWTCADCGGAFSLHDGICSECGGGNRLKTKSR